MIALATLLHSRSSWQGVRLAVAAGLALGVGAAVAIEVGAPVAGAELRAGVADGDSSTVAGPPQAAATKRTARTQPTVRTISTNAPAA
ncbi:MAG: hypothetical protein AUH44_02245 [Chloroflexi bacterium 13_1_40CM_68_15]|nr:MAG: hypothetical protein AUH44_02245 [Chloroflexi bacterium 13_1_40CM_68_15]